MEVITDLVGILVVMSSTSLFVVLSIRNVAQDQPRAWRAAAQESADVVSRWAVWVAVALTSAYGLWSAHDRWGLVWIGLALAVPISLGAATAATLGLQQRRRSSERPSRQSNIYLRSSPR